MSDIAPSPRPVKQKPLTDTQAAAVITMVCNLWGISGEMYMWMLGTHQWVWINLDLSSLDPTRQWTTRRLNSITLHRVIRPNNHFCDKDCDQHPHLDKGKVITNG